MVRLLMVAEAPGPVVITGTASPPLITTVWPLPSMVAAAVRLRVEASVIVPDTEKVIVVGGLSDALACATASASEPAPPALRLETTRLSGENRRGVGAGDGAGVALGAGVGVGAADGAGAGDVDTPGAGVAEAAKTADPPAGDREAARTAVRVAMEIERPALRMKVAAPRPRAGRRRGAAGCAAAPPRPGLSRSST